MPITKKMCLHVVIRDVLCYDAPPMTDSSIVFQVLLLDTNQPTGLDGVVRSVTSVVGPPHNYSLSEAPPPPSQPAAPTRPAASASAAATDVADHAADASQPAQLTPEQVRHNIRTDFIQAVRCVG